MCVFDLYFLKASSEEESKDPNANCISGFGAPMQFKMEGIWYLRGLYSSGFPSIDQEVQCADNHVISFTDVAKYNKFILSNVDVRAYCKNFGYFVTLY
jgi:hypothetical protein